MRETIYRSEQGKNQFLFSSFGQSGFRQFTGQFDRIYEPGVDWSYFLIRDGLVATFKFGGLYHDRARDFSSRRFVFATFGGSLDFRLGAEKIFAQANITPDKIELREITRSTDTYDASHEIYAGYGMADVTLGKKWRFIGGLRAENSRQNLRTFDPFAPNLSPIVTRLETTDPLPSASVVYSMQPSMNLRAGFSRTLNRPEFRELAPFQFTDISGRSTLYGNPNLQRSRINNVDVRWEWFRGEDLFAASFFHKAFDHPIERVLFYAGDVLTSFYNTDRATNNGLELEVRKNLGFLSPRLATWSVYSNYSRIASDVRIGDIPGVILTSKERPLQGQAGYIFNCVAEFTHPRWGSDWRVLYNLVGPRISEVGATLQPDVYEQPNHFLDLSFGQRFKRWERIQLRISAQNLLDRPITHLQGSQVFYRYSLGRTFSLGLSFDVF
jgi:TonB-dependent receptor